MNIANTVSQTSIVADDLAKSQQLIGHPQTRRPAESNDGGTAGSKLQLQAATLQVESQNVASALPAITDVNLAAIASKVASSKILSQPDQAVAAQANLDAEAVYKLLN